MKKIAIPIIEGVAILTCMAFGMLWISDPGGNYEPPFAVSGLVFIITEFYRRYIGKEKEKGKDIKAFWWTGCLDDGLTENPDFFMTVLNKSGVDLPWLNVHVFPSNTFQLEPIEDKTERLMPGQSAFYRFRVLNEDGALTKWAKIFCEEGNSLSIRIFKDRGFEGPVLIDYELGTKLLERINKFK